MRLLQSGHVEREVVMDRHPDNGRGGRGGDRPDVNCQAGAFRSLDFRQGDLGQPVFSALCKAEDRSQATRRTGDRNERRLRDQPASRFYLATRRCSEFDVAGPSIQLLPACIRRLPASPNIRETDHACHGYYRNHA